MKKPSERARRLLWFMLLYLAGLVAVVALAYALRGLFGLAM